MIAVFVLLAAGFLFTFNSFDSGRGAATGQTLLKVDGRSYDRTSLRRMGPNTIQLAQMLNFGEMSGLLGGGNPYQPNTQQFVVNRLIIQNEAKKLGIYPSEQQVRDELQEKIFFNEGKFDSETYNQLTTRTLPNLSLAERDLFALVADKLAVSKLLEVVGSELSPSEEIAKKSYLEENQKLTLQRFEFLVSAITDSIEVTEEEVKAYWSENTTNYMTEPSYKIAYVLASPEYPADEEKSEEEDKEKTSEEKAKEAADRAAARQLAEEAASLKIDEFYVELTENDGKDFNKRAEQLGLTVIEPEAFTPSTVPTELKGRILNDSETLVRKIEETTSNLDNEFEIYHISDVYELPGKKWVIFRALEAIKSAPMTFEAAQEQAKKDLIAKKAEEKVKSQAEEAKTKLTEALEENNDILAAAKSLDLVATKIGPYGARERVPNEFSASALFSAAKQLKTGSATEVIFDGSRAIFAILVAREIEKSETLEASILSKQENMAGFNRYAAFTYWLKQKTEEANVVSNLATEE